MRVQRAHGHLPEAHAGVSRDARRGRGRRACRGCVTMGPSLDGEGVELMNLGTLRRATGSVGRTFACSRGHDAKASYANLGTLARSRATTTSARPNRPRNEDRACLALRPRRLPPALVVYLESRRPDSKGGTRRTSSASRSRRSSTSRVAGGAPRRSRPAAIDALVWMITVYGANHVSHVYVALGDLLALRGDIRLAWTAYADARALGHPRAARWDGGRTICSGRSPMNASRHTTETQR